MFLYTLNTYCVISKLFAFTIYKEKKEKEKKKRGKICYSSFHNTFI